MQDRNIEKLILEMLSRQNALMIDRILPRLEALEEKTGQHDSALTDLITQNLEDLRRKHE